VPGTELAWFWKGRERWQGRAVFGKAPCLSQGLAVRVLAVPRNTVRGAGGGGERRVGGSGESLSPGAPSLCQKSGGSPGPAYSLSTTGASVTFALQKLPSPPGKRRGHSTLLHSQDEMS